MVRNTCKSIFFFLVLAAAALAGTATCSGGILNTGGSYADAVGSCENGTIDGTISFAGYSNVSFINVTSVYPILATGNSSVYINNGAFSWCSFTENTSVTAEDSSFWQEYDGPMTFSGRYASLQRSNVTNYYYADITLSANEMWINNSRIQSLGTYWGGQIVFGGSGTGFIENSLVYDNAVYVDLIISGQIALNVSNSTIRDRLRLVVTGTSALNISDKRLGQADNNSISAAGGFSINYTDTNIAAITIVGSGNSSVLVQNTSGLVSVSSSENATTALLNSASTGSVSGSGASNTSIVNSSFGYCTFTGDSVLTMEDSSFWKEFDGPMTFSGKYASLQRSNVTNYYYQNILINGNTMIMNNSRVRSLGSYWGGTVYFAGSGAVTMENSLIENDAAGGVVILGTVGISASNSTVINLKQAVSGTANFSMANNRFGQQDNNSLSLAGGYSFNYVNTNVNSIAITASGDSSVWGENTSGSVSAGASDNATVTLLNSHGTGTISGSGNANTTMMNTSLGSCSFTENASIIAEDSSFWQEHWGYMTFGGRYVSLQRSNVTTYHYAAITFDAYEAIINNSRINLASLGYSSGFYFSGNISATVQNSTMLGNGGGEGLQIIEQASLDVSDSNLSSVYSTTFGDNSYAKFSNSVLEGAVYLRNYSALNFSHPASNITGLLNVSGGPHPNISGYVRLNGGTWINGTGANVTRWYPVNVTINGAPAAGKNVNARSASGNDSYEGANATTGADGIAFAEVQTQNEAWSYNITAYGSEIGSMLVDFGTSTPEALLIEKNTPDLGLSSGEIWFSPTGLHPELSYFNITVTVRNVGLGNVTGANISWYDNGALFSSSLFDLDGGGAVNITVSHTASITGDHTLLVSADAEGDANPDNDNVTAFFSVYAHVTTYAAPEFDFALIVLLLSAAYIAGLSRLCRRGRN